MNQISEIITTLKLSPIFNMSLGSKELFHSNFIAWMIDSDAIDSESFLKQLVPDSCNEKIVSRHVAPVDREVKNMDIRVWLKDGYNIVFENKVKSLPQAEQLLEYSEALEKDKKSLPSKTTCILLSLTPPSFSLQESKYETNGFRWHLVDYKKLADVLSAQKPTGYQKDLIEDYIGFIRCLHELHKACGQYWEDKTAAIGYGGSLYKKMKEVRLHDIYEKWRMEELKKCLENKLKRTDLQIEVGYSNEQGLLHISPSTQSISPGQYFHAVQIQGHQLRQVLQIDKKKNNFDIFAKANQLIEDGKWFLNEEGDSLPCNQNSKADKRQKGFCKFSSTFAYRHEKLTCVDRVIDLIKIMRELNSNG